MNRNNGESFGTYCAGRSGMQRGNSGYTRMGNMNYGMNMNRNSMPNNGCDSSCNCANTTDNCNDSCTETETVVVVVRDGACENTVERECRPSMNDPISCMPLAMAYVPWQDYEAIYSEAEAWEKGTIFCKLDLDFMARRCN